MLSAVTPEEREVSEEELAQYGAMGTIVHGMVELALKGETNPTKLYQDFSEEWKIVSEGSLGLNPSDSSPIGFIEAHPEITFGRDESSIEVEMFDDELQVCGTADNFGKYLDFPATIDFKSSRSYSREKKEKYFKQIAMYSLMKERLCGIQDKYLVIAPLNPKNKSGYGKAIVSDEVQKYQQLALEDLRRFKEMYILI